MLLNVLLHIGNPNGSTLRKLRKGGGHSAETDPALIEMVSNDDNKKLTKKELSYRLFEATRFRSLDAGDYVCAKMASHDLWILARVVQQWNAVNIPHRQMMDLSEVGSVSSSLFECGVFS